MKLDKNCPSGPRGKFEISTDCGQLESDHYTSSRAFGSAGTPNGNIDWFFKKVNQKVNLGRPYACWPLHCYIKGQIFKKKIRNVSVCHIVYTGIQGPSSHALRHFAKNEVEKRAITLIIIGRFYPKLNLTYILWLYTCVYNMNPINQSFF